MMKKEWLKETMEIMNVVECNPMIYWDGKIRCVHIDDWMIHSASTSHKELEVVKLEDFYAHENAKIMFRMKEEDMPKAEAWVKNIQILIIMVLKRKQHYWNFAIKESIRDMVYRKYAN